MDFFGGGHMVFRRNVGDQSLQQSIKEGEQKKSTANEGKIIIIFRAFWEGGGVSCKFNIVTHQKSLTPPSGDK